MQLGVSYEDLLEGPNDITDTNGRYYAHMSNNPVFTKNSIPGREGYVTDLQALREFSQHKGDIVSFIEFVRTVYPHKLLTPKNLWNFSSALDHMPIYLTLRAVDPLSRQGALPPSVLDTSRVAAGIVGVISNMGKNRLDVDTPMSPKELYDYANGGNPDGINFFLGAGDNMESCPAGEQAVIGILRTMIERGRKRPYIPPDADWAGCITSEELARCLDFGPREFEFSRIYERMGSLPEDDLEGRNRLTMRMAELYGVLNTKLGYR